MKHRAPWRKARKLLLFIGPGAVLDLAIATGGKVLEALRKLSTAILNFVEMLFGSHSSFPASRRAPVEAVPI